MLTQFLTFSSLVWLHLLLQLVLFVFVPPSTSLRSESFLECLQLSLGIVVVSTQLVSESTLGLFDTVLESLFSQVSGFTPHGFRVFADVFFGESLEWFVSNQLLSVFGSILRDEAFSIFFEHTWSNFLGHVSSGHSWGKWADTSASVSHSDVETNSQEIFESEFLHSESLKLGLQLTHSKLFGSF